MLYKLRRKKVCGVEKIRTTISTIELKRLLVELKEKRSDIHIRIRLIGQMWKPNFMIIVGTTDKGIVLYRRLLVDAGEVGHVVPEPQGGGEGVTATLAYQEWPARDAAATA